MKPAFTIPIPLGHVLHWKADPATGLVWETEILRFLTPHEAKWRRPRKEKA